MPRDLFVNVTDPSIQLGTRKWYTVPLAFVVHTLIVGVLIVAPLMATGVLPLPDDSPTYLPVVAPPLPAPPVPSSAHSTDPHARRIAPASTFVVRVAVSPSLV